MTVRHFGKTDMDAFRFTDTFVKSADYAALEAEVSVQKDIVVRMRKLNSKVIAERDEGWNRIAALEARCQRFEAALRKIESNDMRYDLTACAQIAREVLETPVRQAHSKSEYKRLTSLGVDVLPPAETKGDAT